MLHDNDELLLPYSITPYYQLHLLILLYHYQPFIFVCTTKITLIPNRQEHVFRFDTIYKCSRLKTTITEYTEDDIEYKRNYSQ